VLTDCHIVVNNQGFAKNIGSCGGGDIDFWFVGAPATARGRSIVAAATAPVFLAAAFHTDFSHSLTSRHFANSGPTGYDAAPTGSKPLAAPSRRVYG